MDEIKDITPEQREGMAAFWSWFAENQADYFAYNAEDDVAGGALFSRIMEQLSRIDPDLGFEIGPVKNGQRELVISASGLRTLFPLVEEMLSKAPKIDSWRFTAFRPRRSPLMVLEVDEIAIDPADIFVQLFEDTEEKGKIGLVLHFAGYDDDVADVCHQVGYLLLDEALGERDVETKVGFIDFEALGDEVPENALPLPELAPVFDEFHEELNPKAN